MRLKDYDGKCVRITDPDGLEFEGSVSYSGKDFNEVEYGRREDSLDMLNFKFYRSTIDKIVSLENQKGLFGKFSAPFGTLEEMNLQDGIDSIEEALFSEDPDYALRMLICLKHHARSDSGVLQKDKVQLIDLLYRLMRYETNLKIKAETLPLIDLLEEN